MFNLKLDADSSILAMAEVEGIDMFGRHRPQSAECFLERALHDSDNRCSVKYALEQLRNPRWTTKLCAIATIYGNGGWNRWYVYSDGEVVFSAGHGSEYAARRARELGFTVR